MQVLRLNIVALAAATALAQSSLFRPAIPRVWDEREVAAMLVPLAQSRATPEQVSSDFYYRMRVRPIYKSYPIYHPAKEPSGYFDWLREQEPQVIFDTSKLKTEQDWIKAGELVFHA